MAQSFQPYSEDHLRLVQGISFSPSGDVMYFSLPHREYLKAQGVSIDDETPRLAIYQAKKDGHGWGQPELLPFSGKYKDYEPSVSPDGTIMFFNSNRPKEGGKPLKKNNIWFSKKQNGTWQKPRFLIKLNTSELEESYPTISSFNDFIYIKESIVDGVSKFAIYQTKFIGEKTKPGKKISMIDLPKGSGDPWISPDGSYLLFTKFEEDKWAETCDIYISFKSNNSWMKPFNIKEINGNGPDFAVAISPDEKWIYYRKNYQFTKVPFKPILKKYQAIP